MRSPLWYATVGHSKYVFLNDENFILGSTRELDLVFFCAKEYVEKTKARVNIYNRDNDEMVIYIDPKA